MTQLRTPAWDSAMNPAEQSSATDIYGQIEFDIWDCVLEKGPGKVPYIEGQHAPSKKLTAVTVMLSDLGGNNYKRDFIAEFPADGWKGVTLPSLKTLGVTDLFAVNGAFVHAEMVKFATYKKQDGTEGAKTAPKVLAIYKNADECAAAAQGQGQGAQDDLLSRAANGANGNGANGTQGSDAERKVAEAFLQPIVKTAVRGNGIDIPTLEAALKSNPILAKYFTLTSPEVIAAMTTALAEPAF